MRDVLFLGQKSEEATEADRQIITDLVMVNPVIMQKTGAYETEEGCLSLDGVRKTKRFQKIKVQYLDESFQKQTQEYQGGIAQIIQHECDHMEGIII